MAFWESIKDSTNRAEFHAYLTNYPNGKFIDIARLRLKEPEPAPSGSIRGAQWSVKASINATTLRAGDALSILVEPSQPVHVAIFRCLPYEKGREQVGLLFPNPYDTVSLLGKETRIPTTDAYKLEIGFPPNQGGAAEHVDEYLTVVATSLPISFKDSYNLDEFDAATRDIVTNGVGQIVKLPYVVKRR